MADVVTTAVDGLVARVNAVNSVRNRTLQIYEQAELMDIKKKLSYPCVGVVYIGLLANETNPSHQNTMRLVAEIEVLGLNYCNTRAGQINKVTDLMGEIRDAVHAPPSQASQNKWVLQSELPMQINDEGKKILGYALRVETVVCLS